jgi:hypothetical protein
MKEKKTLEFVVSVVANLIGIAIINTAIIWRQYTKGVILESWIEILWAANLSMIVQIVGNLLLAIYRPARMYSLLQAIFAGVGLVSVVVFYHVFPLDFSQIVGSWLNTLLKAVLIIAMAGLSIAIVVNLVRAVTGTQYDSVRTQ